jgi:hypothetical protein
MITKANRERADEVIMKKCLAFVLGSGGARGALQVGALRTLFEVGYHPDLLTRLLYEYQSTTVAFRAIVNPLQGASRPAFVGLADLQNLPQKWHGFRIFAHNPEISGSLA